MVSASGFLICSNNRKQYGHFANHQVPVSLTPAIILTVGRLAALALTGLGGYIRRRRKA